MVEGRSILYSDERKPAAQPVSPAAMVNPYAQPKVRESRLSCLAQALVEPLRQDWILIDFRGAQAVLHLCLSDTPFCLQMALVEPLVSISLYFYSVAAT